MGALSCAFAVAWVRDERFLPYRTRPANHLVGLQGDRKLRDHPAPELNGGSHPVLPAEPFLGDQSDIVG